MAVVRLVGGVSEEMSVDEVMEILSACYEAILMSQLTGRVTLEMQQENERCRAAIDLRERLIARYLGVWSGLLPSTGFGSSFKAPLDVTLVRPFGV